MVARRSHYRFPGDPSGAPSQLSAVALDGGTPTELTDAAGNSANPVWIDGATRITYEYQLVATNEIRPMDLHGSNVETSSLAMNPPRPHFAPAFDWRT
jgi:Tol biopolymer transport system component